MMNKVLINFAHPMRSRSRMNNALLCSVERIDGVTINDLYAHYPDFLIDVSREQKLCEEHDVIIFQHPFYWYSTPSIMKEWMDLVLQHGWAYGSEGKALQGKWFLQAITTGGDDSTYRKEGFNAFTIRDLTSPYRATANLCGMAWLPPFTVMGIHRSLTREEIQEYCKQYHRCVLALRDSRFDLDKVKSQLYLNSNLNQVTRGL